MQLDEEDSRIQEIARLPQNSLASRCFCFFFFFFSEPATAADPAECRSPRVTVINGTEWEPFDGRIGCLRSCYYDSTSTRIFAAAENILRERREWA